MKTPFILSGLVIALLASPVMAQDTDAPSPLASIYACADITESLERLACFDAQVTTLRQREEAREVVAIDAETAKELKRDSFGFKLPSLPKLKLPKLGGGDDGEGPEEVRLAVKDVRKRGRDWVVEMENGQVWIQTSGRLNYVPSGDLEAIISEAALGSFRLKLTNGKTTVKGLKVRRIQ